MRCAVCLREQRGFGYVVPAHKITSRIGWKNRRAFCSMLCHDIYANSIKRGNAVIDPTRHEKDAMQSALAPLGEYVSSIGMHRSLNNYSKEEVLTLVEVIVTAYHDHLRTAIGDEPEWSCHNAGF